MISFVKGLFNDFLTIDNVDTLFCFADAASRQVIDGLRRVVATFHAFHAGSRAIERKAFDGQHTCKFALRNFQVSLVCAVGKGSAVSCHPVEANRIDVITAVERQPVEIVICIGSNCGCLVGTRQLVVCIASGEGDTLLEVQCARYVIGRMDTTASPAGITVPLS